MNHDNHGGHMNHGDMNHDHMGHGDMGHDHMGHMSTTVPSSLLSNMASVLSTAASTVLSNSSMPDMSSVIDHSDHGSSHDMVSDMVGSPGQFSHGSHNVHASHDMTGCGGMSMFFHFGTQETILFSGWTISTIGGLIGSMVAIFFIALAYEGLKYFREYLFKKSISASYASPADKESASNRNENNGRPMQYMDQVLLHTPTSIMSGQHFLQTCLHMVQFVISYCLMLIFMTYNVWLCLACVLGSGLGYFMFGWKKSVVVDVTEHCH